MKKVLILMGLCMIMLAGCGQKHNDNKENQAERPEVTGVGKENQKPEATAEDADLDQIGSVLTDSIQITGLAKEIVENMTLEEKVGQMFILQLESLDTSKGTYYEHRTFTNKMAKTLQDYPVGGVILFSRNIENREQTIALNKAFKEHSRIPIWVSVDEEGGDVARLANNPNMKMTQYPPMEVVGATENEDYCYQMGANMADEMRELGFNLDFAPVADVKTNENNTEIGNRSFGDDPDLVAKLSTAVVNGLQNNHVSATLKHFPGHGDAEGDTHETSVNIESDINRFRTIDFIPFEEGIKAGADLIMVSHISISRVAGNTTPASLSSLVMKDIIRKELGFKGVIVTDAMNMKAITSNYTSSEAAIEAVKAGADVILIPDNFVEAYNGIVNQVIEGEISESRIDQSVQRIIETKIKRGMILSDTDLIH